MKVTIGRIVHFHAPSACVGPGSVAGPYAALVTGLNENGTINLTTFGPTGSIYPQQNVSMGGPEGATPTPGCWNWPPKES